ncbi:MAG TPA: hypothetical protein PKA24_17730, partial [Microthrixaceae bacterium]|nr:hypothetical protein [Microthrixaceae bacterium]
MNPRSIEQGNQLLLEFPRAAERLGAGGSGSMAWIDGQAVAVVGITEECRCGRADRPSGPARVGRQ